MPLQSIKTSTVILLAIIIGGCSDIGTSPEEEALTGSFVMDSYSVACTVKVNPINDSLWAYLPFTLRYHFEGWPGTINYFTIWAENYEGTGLHLDYAYPDSVGKIYIWSSGFWVRNALIDVDTLTVQCYLNGPFWNSKGEEPRFLGGFEWTNRQRIPVHR